MDAGVGGATGAVALATSAEKNEEKKVFRDEYLEQLWINSSQSPSEQVGLTG